MTPEEALRTLQAAVLKSIDSNNCVTDAIDEVNQGGFHVKGLHVTVVITPREVENANENNDNPGAPGARSSPGKEDPCFDASFLRAAHIAPDFKPSRPKPFHRWPSKKIHLGLVALLVAGAWFITGCGDPGAFQLRCPAGTVEVTPAPLPNQTPRPNDDEFRRAPVCGVL